MKIHSGLVTFLFTDVEGSTQLAQLHPEKINKSLRRQNEIISGSVSVEGGIVFKTTGDSNCCVFENPDAALRAAVGMQSKLSSENWDKAAIKVRAGIHTGHAEWRGDDFEGYVTLATVSRIMSAASGGQILISEDARKEISFSDARITFRDMGSRRLKDVMKPVRLFQVIADGLPQEFPPLKTIDARLNNLPFQISPFIGRTDEVSDICQRLRSSRLLTILGTGGAGKTRTALKAAENMIDEFENGVWETELDLIVEPNLLSQKILESLGLKEQQGRSPEESLLNYVKDKELLLLLDNCEHLVENVAVLAEKLLRASPKIKILCTSRAALKCSGESIHFLSAMKVPADPETMSAEQLLAFESVKLFLEKARSVDTEFSPDLKSLIAISNICTSIDGIPLAIELAAAKVKLLDVTMILGRLNDRFTLLKGGSRTALPRHRTMLATIEWSYDLLEEDERTLWNRLSVFTGGWGIEAAEDVCSFGISEKNDITELLGNLVEKSIIGYDNKKKRFRMLESIREFGEMKLRSGGEYEAINEKHREYFFKLISTAVNDHQKLQDKNCLLLLDNDNENAEKALQWGITQGRSDEILSAGSQMGYYWRMKGQFYKGLSWLQKITDHAPSDNSHNRGKLIGELSVLYRMHGDLDRSEKLMMECLKIWDEPGKEIELGYSYTLLGNIFIYKGKYTEAEKSYTKSYELLSRYGSREESVIPLVSLGNILWYKGNLKKSAKVFAECAGIFRNKQDKTGTARCLACLANIEFAESNFLKSIDYIDEAIELFEEAGEEGQIPGALNSKGHALTGLGRIEEAKSCFVRSMEEAEKSGNMLIYVKSLESLGIFHYSTGEFELSKEYFLKTIKLSEELGDMNWKSFGMLNLGNAEFELGNISEAESLYRQSLEILRNSESALRHTDCMNRLCHVCLLKKDVNEALGLIKASIQISSEIENERGIVSALLSASEALSINERYTESAALFSFAEKFFKESGKEMTGQEKSQRERILSVIRKGLSQDEIMIATENSRHMKIEEAIAIALGI